MSGHEEPPYNHPPVKPAFSVQATHTHIGKMKPRRFSLGDENEHNWERKYDGLTRAQLHDVAVERAEHYAQMRRHGEPFHLLLDAWQWIENRLRDAP